LTAFNRGVTFADAFVVATPLLTGDGRLIAAISAAVDASEADRLDAVGEELKRAVATLGSKYAPDGPGRGGAAPEDVAPRQVRPDRQPAFGRGGRRPASTGLRSVGREESMRSSSNQAILRSSITTPTSGI
jgi:hypothetical protein